MKSSTRKIMAFIALILTTVSFAGSQNQPEPPETKTITISGSVGLADVMMEGFPGGPIVTDSNGKYSATVESGWSGTIRPMKRGYLFRPASKTYSDKTKNLTNQDYAVEQITLTISGRILNGNRGVSSVMLNGFPGNAVTDENGNYNVSVTYGWTGTITPIKEGYSFRPAAKTYPPMTEDLINEDYSMVKTFLIHGETGEAGVLMRGLPGNPLTDRDGFYKAGVEYGWTGVVTPVKDGYEFDPPNRTYADVTGNLDNQDYWPTEISISRMFEDSVSRRVLIVPTSETKIGDFEQTTEDMLVMLHIFDEKIQDEPDSIRGVLRNYGDIFGRDNKTSKAIYIQDYGVLFLMEVDLPLVFPSQPQLEQPEQTEQEDVDPVWQQAKEQVFSPKEDVTGMRTDAHSQDIQKRVEQVKNELIRTLKYASNIRNIEPDDWVILSVTGWGESTSRITPYYRYGMTENRTDTRRRSRSVDGRGGSYNTSGSTTRSGMGGPDGRSGGYAGGSYGGGGFATGNSSSSFSSGSFSAGSYGRGGFGGMEVRGQMDISSAAVLTICTRKSDVDAFAENELDFEQFRQKINIFVY